MAVSADVMNWSQSGATSWIEPIAGITINDCNGEPLAFDGTVHRAYSIIENDTMVRIVAEINLQVNAIGQFSGTEYLGLTNRVSTYMYTEGLPLNEPQTEVLQLRARLISQGGQFVNALFTYAYQRMLDHNGNVRVYVINEGLECIEP